MLHHHSSSQRLMVQLMLTRLNSARGAGGGTALNFPQVQGAACPQLSLWLNGCSTWAAAGKTAAFLWFYLICFQADLATLCGFEIRSVRPMRSALWALLCQGGSFCVVPYSSALHVLKWAQNKLFLHERQHIVPSWKSREGIRHNPLHLNDFSLKSYIGMRVP